MSQVRNIAQPLLCDREARTNSFFVGSRRNFSHCKTLFMALHVKTCLVLKKLPTLSVDMKIETTDIEPLLLLHEQVLCKDKDTSP